METKEENSEEGTIYDLNATCRLCSNVAEKFVNFYTAEGLSCELVNKINMYLPVKVSIDDDLPLQTCLSCTSSILAWHEFVYSSIEWDQKLKTLNFSKSTKSGEENSDSESVGPPEDIAADSSPEETSVKPSHKCSNCNKTFTRLASYNQHVNLCSKTTKPGSKCKSCNIKVSRSRDLKRHEKSCRENMKNPFHKLINLKTKSCKQCHISFRKLTELTGHIAEVHNVQIKRLRRSQNDINPSWFCDVCKKGYTRKFDMIKHRKKAHLDENLAESSVSEGRRKNIEFLRKCRTKNSQGAVVFQCDVCPKTFTKSYGLMRHRTIHTGSRSYFCHLCGKSFRTAHGLTRHITEFHEGVKKFECNVCKMRFCSNSSLKEHLNIHTNTRPFECDVCGKTYKQRASLFVHKKYHTENFPFVCGVCGKKFRMSGELRVHSWLHTGHKPHACPKCSATFRLGQDLKRHLKVHEKLQECVCEECGSTFTQQRYLKLHSKIHMTQNKLTV